MREEERRRERRERRERRSRREREESREREREKREREGEETERRDQWPHPIWTPSYPILKEDKKTQLTHLHERRAKKKARSGRGGERNKNPAKCVSIHLTACYQVFA